MNTNIRQSDNTFTVGWRTIWGLFTIEQLEILTTTIPVNTISNTFYSKNRYVSSIEALKQYASQNNNPTKQWGYFFDYPEQYHDQVWDIVSTFDIVT